MIRRRRKLHLAASRGINQVEAVCQSKELPKAAGILRTYRIFRSNTSATWRETFSMGTKTSEEFARFDVALSKALSISHDELKRREKEWKKQRKTRRRAKPASRVPASSG